MTRKIVKRSTFFAPDHLKVWPTVGPGSTGNLDWIMQICIIIESNEVFLDQNFCRVLSWNYDFKKTIIFNLWLLNHCPLWEPKFSDPDARRQTSVSFFLAFRFTLAGNEIFCIEQHYRWTGGQLLHDWDPKLPSGAYWQASICKKNLVHSRLHFGGGHPTEY